jgi:hypothetical protein
MKHHTQPATGPRDPRTPRATTHPQGPYDGLPSVTNVEWGPDRSDDAYTFGYPGQGGYGDFTANRTRGLQPTGHRGRGPKGYVRSDERIADDIVQRLTDDPHIDASEILVMVESGNVTLTGNVPERRMKHRAEDLVADASGVRELHNRIRVDDGSRSAGRPGAAIRSGRDQLGSGFSSSARMDPVYDNPRDDSNWPGP